MSKMDSADPLATTLLEEMIVCEPYSTSDLAATVSHSQRTVHRRLGELAENGCIERKEIASGSVVWWRDRPASER